MQVYSLTQIPPERQKILLKGGQLRDDSDMKTFNLKANQTIMVLGSPESKVESVAQPKFVEDMKDVQVASSDPSGLINLGNTCYMNSSLQLLFELEELNKQLSIYDAGSSLSQQQKLLRNMKDLFAKMGAKEAKITPLNVLSSMRANFPQFSEISDNGLFKQQDAEEAFSQILQVFLSQFESLEKFFKIELKSITKCLETEEPATVSFEDVLKLNCHISIKTNFLRDGLLDNLVETIEKNNDSLGRNANYEVSRKIVRLPKYLTVHFMRFFWKRDTGKKSKILRRVQFPFTLDLSDLLDDDVKESKCKVRDSLHILEKENHEELRALKKAKTNDQEALSRLSQQRTTNLSKAFPEGFDPSSGENPSCVYELQSVITHQGSTADSGHYQYFTRDATDPEGNRWWKFNDDKVSTVSSDKIESLAGGGESDSALILMYKGVGL